ncbi:hypothetical protein GDO81_011952 [Engystomops pustulosus]|uniref:Uncharacterized protein n=1 Tax=Engystomops pustulosus TaxID=76066 RepID=A0AAV7BI49_ENGPU|nr:hypothetical protein GDO81_011952 [Engystomops pustulosus]
MGKSNNRGHINGGGGGEITRYHKVHSANDGSPQCLNRPVKVLVHIKRKGVGLYIHIEPRYIQKGRESIAYP